MKRLQIMIEEDVDAALDAMARKGKTSKAALIRQFVGERVRAFPPLSADPLWQMVGVDDVEPVGIDDIVYG